MKKSQKNEVIRKSFSFDELSDYLIFHDMAVYQVNRIGEKCIFFVNANIAEDEDEEYLGLNDDFCNGSRCYVVELECKVKHIEVELIPEIIERTKEHTQKDIEFLKELEEEKKRNLKYYTFFNGTWCDFGYDVKSAYEEDGYVWVKINPFKLKIKLEGKIKIRWAPEFSERVDEEIEKL